MIKEAGFPELSKLIARLRKKDVAIKPGYDGVYGTISFFEKESDRAALNDQIGFGF
jgi:PHP family Zn ribbon phosphoesterase